MRITRRGLLTVLLGTAIAGGLALGTVYAVLTSPWAADRVKARMVAFLEERFDADVSLGDVQISLVPRLAIDGRELALRRRNVDDEPFIRLSSFHVSGSPLGLLRRHVERVAVDGFEVRIQRGERRTQSGRANRTTDVTVQTIVVRDGRLLILPRDPAKLPLEFDLREVTMEEFGFDRASSYHARLTNPKPRGRIESTGRIGPWDTRELGDTQVSGDYVFADADLGTIDGIAGTLQSTGNFDGNLDRINVQGTTTTPNFRLDLADQPMRLDTTFQALVDGTNGDTHLEKVDAMLGETRILAKGSVTGIPGVKGRRISLAVQVDEGRFEDFLRLTVKGNEPPMKGTIALQSSFELPPGPKPVPERLELAGSFRIERGRFTSDTVQDRIDSLSRRGRGEPTNEEVQNVLSAFGGRMTLADGTLRLPRFEFRVRGAAVDLGGSYRLRTEALAFTGTLKLDAPLSKTTTGFKSFLLRAIDPLFRKNGSGAALPIKVGGTVDQPSFGLDMGRVLKR